MAAKKEILTHLREMLDGGEVESAQRLLAGLDETHLADDFAELEAWMSDIGKTMQITRRSRVTPVYVVRIWAFPDDRRNLRSQERGVEVPYVEGYDDDLKLAFEKAVELWYTRARVPNGG